MEIPRFIRSDFLLIILGICFAYFPFYAGIIKDSPFTSYFLFSAGLLMAYFGLVKMKNDYDVEMEIKELEYVKFKCSLVNYFKKNRVISRKHRKQAILNIRDFVTKRI